MKLTQDEAAMVERMRRGESWEAPWEPARTIERAVEEGDSGSTLGDYETWRDAILKEREKRRKLMSVAMEKRKP